MRNIICFSCRAPIPDVEGPTHPYILSTPGCWKSYGEVLAKDYTPEYYDVLTHRIIVDSYAVSHPGNKNDRRAVRSVNIHLVSLFSIFEKKLGNKMLFKIIKKSAEDKNIDKLYIWLDTPDFNDTFNVTDVLKARNESEHKEFANKWGISVWNRWKTKHESTISALSERIVSNIN